MSRRPEQDADLWHFHPADLRSIHPALTTRVTRHCARGCRPARTGGTSTLGPKAIIGLEVPPGEGEAAVQARVRAWLAERPDSEDIVFGWGERRIVPRGGRGEKLHSAGGHAAAHATQLESTGELCC